MDEIQAPSTPVNIPEVPRLPASTSKDEPVKKESSRVGMIAGVVIVLILLIAATVYLLTPGAPTAQIRDIFIILLALEFLLVGGALTILVIQLATLINLLQNEIKPILTSTNDTLNNLKGTSEFLSEHVTAPVIKMNEYLAGIKKLLDLVFPGKK